MPKLSIPKSFEVIANQKATKTSKIGNECREKKRFNSLKLGWCTERGGSIPKVSVVGASFS
jgi:hypothetical protein